MAGACDNVSGREMHTDFSWVHLRERDYLEDLGINGRIRLK